ncbi:hypothetical protein TraAM80_08656 [Trypanosoma rangeli]|uniref:Uncharacterized protein n=1 Tax=Trypanosoma rangeli TaxID=5698 RepID=A0A422MZG5_TRYRA|nr:uncharacterized protein TraAM80_08656 [Trypanosoma rangeli]RNE98635.1 hypothetical protein TraAM80_08656 [Trypanosoma rangeli]|eukprot:RNE98635.1 hypothetical protein TraAM80_08656 [Trypanosoma rangeli]
MQTQPAQPIRTATATPTKKKKKHVPSHPAKHVGGVQNPVKVARHEREGANTPTEQRGVTGKSHRIHAPHTCGGHEHTKSSSGDSDEIRSPARPPAPQPDAYRQGPHTTPAVPEPHNP